MPIPRLSSGDRPRFAAWLGVALLLKALIPAGWMPVSVDGGVRLAPCGGWAKPAAPAPVAAPAPQHDAHTHHGMGAPSEAAAPTPAQGQHDGGHDGGQAGDQPCTFAGASFAWTFVDAPPLIEPLAPAPAPAQLLPHTVATGRGLAAPPPPATGPPLTA